MQIDFKQATHHLRQFIKSSKDLLESIPTKNDDIPTIVLKSMALADKGYTYFFGNTDTVVSYFEKQNVVKKDSINFVKLFFKALVTDNCIVKSMPIDSDTACITVNVPNNGSLYFIENTYDGKREDFWGTFYHTPDFNFRDLLTALWKTYNGRIYASLDSSNKSWQKITSFTSFPMPDDTIYGSSVERLKSLKKKNYQCRSSGIPRAYLLLGEPGTGKSSFAAHMAAGDDRIIKFDAKSLESFDAESIDFLLENLEPQFIIIDDIDKITFGSTISTLLYVLELIKLKHPKITVILTANELDTMDPALLRPGRIDEILEFECSKEDRKAILVGYLSIFALKLKKDQIEKALICTEGLTGAYIKEFVIQTKFSSFEEVFENFQRRRKLLGLEEPEVPDEETKQKRKKKKATKKKKVTRKKIGSEMEAVLANK